MTEIQALFKIIEINPLVIYYSGHGVMKLDAIDSMSIVAVDGDLIDITSLLSKFSK